MRKTRSTSLIPRSTSLIQRVLTSGTVAALGLSACSGEPDPLPDAASLPASALAAFQDHLQTMSEGDLSCTDAAIEAVPRAVGFVNDDPQPDYALVTQHLRCRSDRGSALAYFCGQQICAFPALMSDGEGYRVIWLMSGNEIETRTDYQETRFVVRQGGYAGADRSAVVVREYIWRDGDLRRVAEREELANRQP